jgi:hypothetical protein
MVRLYDFTRERVTFASISLNEWDFAHISTDLTPPITSADETFVGLLEISAPKAGNTPTSSYKALVHLDLSYFSCYI